MLNIRRKTSFALSIYTQSQCLMILRSSKKARWRALHFTLQQVSLFGMLQQNVHIVWKKCQDSWHVPPSHIFLTFFPLYFKLSGIDPKKSKVFVQSHVPAHTELAWLLNCATPMNWLERMIQFKDKAKKQGTDSVGVGLFTYPILMAADILLYQADRVPVGEDQRQHLELARDITRRFNDQYCKGGPFKKRCKAAGIPSFPTFTEPEAMIVKQGARIMSLMDGTAKMSKSDPNDNSRINVLDSPETIRAKVKKCKTDAEKGIEWDNPDRPEATNLLSIYAAVQPGRSKESILEEVAELSWGDFKPLLADAIVAHLEPIQKKYASIREDPTFLEGVLRDGADSANEVADKTLGAARVAMGFVPRPR